MGAMMLERFYFAHATDQFKLKMISHFELKNRPCCRLYHKIPYFIKNIILLSLLALILGINYLVN